MALFNKKKEFPKYPKIASLPVPKYERTMEDMAEPKTFSRLPEIPRKFPEQELSMKPFPDLGPSLFDEMPQRKPEKIELRSPEPYSDIMYTPQREMPMGFSSDSSQPLFVKLEDYKNAIKSLQEVRTKINEAESILSDLMEMKRKEDAQLTRWQAEISDVKTRLLEMDRQLFEVSR